MCISLAHGAIVMAGLIHSTSHNPKSDLEAVNLYYKWSVNRMEMWVDSSAQNIVIDQSIAET